MFARLAELLGKDFAVYSSENHELGILDTEEPVEEWAYRLGPIRRVFPGLDWQYGAVNIPVSTGDVLVLSGAPRTLSTLFLLAKGKLKGAKIIWWGQYWSATSQPWRATIRFTLMRLPDAIMLYTDQEVNEYLSSQKRGSDSLVKGLNNGIETSSIRKFREPYLATKRPRDLVFMGRITAKAELGLVIQALGHTVCSNFTLDVIGDGPEKERLQEQANLLGISDRIIWRGATTDEARIAEVANLCKAFIYPGAVGLSLIHGFAYGLPAIVHDNRWKHMPEISAHRPGENGVTFSQGDADTLANTIAWLLDRPQLLQMMSAEATATTESTFNTEDMAQRFSEMINRLR